MIEVIKGVLFLKENDNKYDILISLDGGVTFKKISTISKFKDLIANPIALIPVDVGDYSDGTNAFAKYTPPATAEEGQQIIVIDTGNPGGKRLYIYANGGWHYVSLT